MRIDALTLEGFRNYEKQSLSFDPNCNVIYGENAQGKTNLLEAMVYLSCGRSPRARADREMIGFERDSALIAGQIDSRGRTFKTEIRLQRGKRRKMTVNGVTAKNNAALSHVLHTVFFCPEDLFLIRDGAAARRRLWTFPSVSSVRATPKPWPSTAVFMSIRPVFCATVRTIRSFCRPCPILTQGSVRQARC